MSEPSARILIIDDEAPIRRFLRVALEASGYGVLEAGDGRRGLEAAALEGPDLVILDLGCPTSTERQPWAGSGSGPRCR